MALRELRIEDAIALSRKALIQAPEDPDRLTDAARAAAAAGDHREASQLLVDAATFADFQPESRVQIALQSLLEVGDAYAAMDLLSQTLVAQPSNHKFRRVLLGLLGETGRTDLMQPHYESLVRSRQFDIAVLLACTDTSERLFPPETMDALVKRNPDDGRLRLGEAQSLRDQRRFAEAEALLREIIHNHPQFAPALAMLGRMPSIQHAPDANLHHRGYDDWLAKASPHCSDQADYWIARGDHHFHAVDYAAAIRCYQRAATLAPNRALPWSQIARSIRQTQAHPGERQLLNDAIAVSMIAVCEDRAEHLLELRMHLQRLGGSNERSQRAATDVARTLNEMDRLWEAEAWAAIATTLPDDKTPDVQSLRAAIIAKLQRNQQWASTPNLSSLDVLGPIDTISHRATIDSPSPPTEQVVVPNECRLHLADETLLRGLAAAEIDYPDIASALIYSMGSGGGTLDFDLDGWSDLVLNSSGKMQGQDATSNSLLRNLEGQFNDVRDHAGCGTSTLGQGITIGDYNEDGWPDVFLANIGPNRLLRNNGDGTFTDDSASLADGSQQWTTCGAFLDIDRDGITDLISVNYCDLNSAVDEPCQTQSNTPQGTVLIPAPCHPARFPAERDRVAIGNGRGGFAQRFEANLQQISSGRGLGVLAGSLDASSQSILIANDMSANHLLKVSGRGSIAGSDDCLIDQAVLSAVAVDGASLAQASMGIAYGDFDGDLDLDLYVTGFAREYNIYYEQSAPGLWVDSTIRHGLIESTLATVGFGTQAIDVDGDGILELAVTNGHIGEFGPSQPPLQQPFQLMRRSTQASTRGGFDVVDQASGNAYLDGNHIGRALWTIDVDRDLASDLVVTHQNAPPVLLCNRTKTNHHRIGICCVGTTSSRDAIGATVQFVASGRTRKLWLLSGDGYMSSNERILKAGIGRSEQIDDVTVTWPSGTIERFGSLLADQTVLLVEGTGEAFANH